MTNLITVAPFVFAGLVLLCCGTAAVFGGREGRWVACLYIAASVATNIASRFSWDWTRPNHVVLAIDAALLIGLYVVAMTSRRYWPLWITGLHLLTVSAHLGAIVAPTFQFKVYFILEVMWSLPKMGVLLIGVLGDWRQDREPRSRRGAERGGGQQRRARRSETGR